MENKMKLSTSEDLQGKSFSTKKHTWSSFRPENMLNSLISSAILKLLEATPFILLVCGIINDVPQLKDVIGVPVLFIFSLATTILIASTIFFEIDAHYRLGFRKSFTSSESFNKNLLHMRIVLSELAMSLFLAAPIFNFVFTIALKLINR